MRKKLKYLLLLCVFILLSGESCKVSNSTPPEQNIPLVYWRVWDGPDTFQPIIDRYNQLHPQVSIQYRMLKYEEYEQKLLESFASDQAPDLLSIHNTWTRKYQSKNWISPMPAKTSMVYPITKGSLKKELVYEKRERISPTLNTIREKYVDMVYNDVVIKTTNPKTDQKETGVYGFPMAVDTLVMFVNRDLFNNAGITNIPKYWDKDFQQTVRKLTKQDNKGQIIQSGVALGGGNNIERSGDILSVLMMQNGTEMMNLEGTQVTINKVPSTAEDQSKIPGLDAFRFYTDFANPAKEVYAWNINMENSLDLFIRGKVAMMFGYSYMLPQIKAGNPKMNLFITRLPQIEGNDPVNFGNYWVEGVTSKSKYKNEAWDFLLFATEAEQARLYLDITKKLTAIRSMVDEQKQDLEIGPYAEQSLTAKSWFRGYDTNAADSIIKDEIEQVVGGRIDLESAIEELSAKVQQTINPTF